MDARRSVWPLSAKETRRVLVAEGDRLTLLLYRDPRGDLHVRRLTRPGRLLIGRGPDCDVVIDWDARVSRVHAELERAGDGWTLRDDGLSKNGTYLNDERVVGRRDLRDGDLLRVGDTVLVVRVGRAS